MTPPPTPWRTLLPPALADSLVGLRRQLHRFPELSLVEHATAARLEAALQPLSPSELARVAGTGVVARIAGRDRGAPVVAVRGDIDALPITEETGLDFASQSPGRMHACGHDVHAAWAVGAAALLAERPAVGDVLIVLQPAEELGRGALAILESGVLDGVAAIFGGHVDRRYEVGEVVAQEGALAASCDSFEIELVGAGGHGARPHEARDPIVGAAAVVLALQTIVARRLDPTRSGVVTVARLRGGEALNVIPDRAALGGTLRARSVADREQIRDELVRITTATATAHGLETEIRFLDGTPPVVNAAGPVAWARQAVGALAPAPRLVPLAHPILASEDFAFYLEGIPGCFLRIGAREPGGEYLSAHSPRFYPAEESLFIGAAVLAETARVASEALAGGSEAP
ncbi:MAG TPA: M20 family metallopeptidase [Thermoanaerobaculia bacterium]|nr:M20 family metallopeptidase [Thermoanaerobaculia bacterium]